MKNKPYHSADLILNIAVKPYKREPAFKDLVVRMSGIYKK